MFFIERSGEVANSTKMRHHVITGENNFNLENHENGPKRVFRGYCLCHSKVEVAPSIVSECICEQFKPIFKISTFPSSS